MSGVAHSREGGAADARPLDRPHDSRELVEAFSTGELSPVEVARDTLARIRRVDPRFHAYVAVDENGALRAARIAEERWREWRSANTGRDLRDWASLPLWGVTFSVKDTIEQAGLPTTYGSVAFADNRQPDSAAVQELRRHGVVLLGKTSTSEFALSTVTATRLGPATRNPWDTRRTAGGSSGGAAAAAALGLGAVAIGTDSAGSIRLPASYCGVYGLKPTRGSIPIRQQWRASPVRSHIGPLGRTLEDIVIGMRALTGRAFAPRSGGGASGPVRVGALDSDPHAEAIRGFWGEALSASPAFRWIEPGARLPAPPSSFDDSGRWIFSGDHLAAAEKLSPDFMRRHGHELTPYARPIYEDGAHIRAWEYRRALDRFETYAQDAQSVFDYVDVIITSGTGPAPILPEGDGEGDVGMGERYDTLSLWNYCGNPALSVPAGVDELGLPRSIQLIGPLHAEQALLDCATELEELGLIPRDLSPEHLRTGVDEP